MTRRCRHLWRYVGRAPDFRAQRCVLYRCDRCGKEHEVFSGVVPMTGTAATHEDDCHSVGGTDG